MLVPTSSEMCCTRPTQVPLLLLLLLVVLVLLLWMSPGLWPTLDVQESFPLDTSFPSYKSVGGDGHSLESPATLPSNELHVHTRHTWPCTRLWAVAKALLFS